MHLTELEVKNFRSLKSVKIELLAGANLFVGPNAVGKSTVLEAVRLAKATVAPRTANEGRQALMSLGALSATQQMNIRSIAGDPKAPIEITCKFGMNDQDCKFMGEGAAEIARSIMAARQGIDLNSPGAEASMIQLLSTPVGRTMRDQILRDIQGPLGDLLKKKVCTLGVKISPDGTIEGKDGISQIVFTVLEKRLPPGKTLLSHFPADRAMAGGDAQIQIGANDAIQQIESHNSQPSLKYQRLKNVIFTALLSGEPTATEQKKNFESIFSGLLKEKELESAVVNEYGQATVLIKESDTGKSVDIDSLSSGEKGLILTFLLIARTVEAGGLVLLDEPELHLNSGVCKNLLDFLIDHFLRPRGIQALICTHSAEVMSAAFRRDDCAVFNMRRDRQISRIRGHDHGEATQALRQLGTTEIETLLFDAVVFVEGPDDVELLEFAFRDLITRIKFRELTGRGEVEKYIRLLIDSDKKGNTDSTKFFIFDRDSKPTNLQSTNKVKLKQWNRYCLENYLIEPDVLYDTIQADHKPKKWPETHSDACELFKMIAKSQLRSRVIEEVYREQGFQDIQLRRSDKKETVQQAARLLHGKLNTLKDQLALVTEEAWLAKFEKDCDDRLRQEEPAWESDWIKLCNGKQFITDLYEYAKPQVDIRTLKKSLLAQNKSRATGSWNELQQVVQELLKKIP
jgi:predicted ATPase